MSITVQEALQLPAFQNAKLVAGKEGLNRVISSVNVMEVPDISKYIKPNELLVTTTYPIKDDKQSQIKLIPDLVRNNVAALAIVPEFYNDEIPQTMIIQADKCHFPLIQLPKDTSFNEIINPVLEEILNHQAVILRRNNEAQKKFINLLLNGGSLDEIARMIFSLRGTPVSIYSIYMKLLASAGDLGEDQKSLFYNIEKFRDLSDGHTVEYLFDKDGHSLKTYIKPVIVAGEKYAYVVLGLQDVDCPSQAEIDMIDQASMVIALEVSRIKDLLEAEQNFRNRIFEDLLEDRIESKNDFLALGESQGLDLSTGFIPVVVEIDGFNNIYDGPAGNNNQIMILRKFRDAMSSSINLSYPGAIVVDLKVNNLILFPVKNPLVAKNAARKINEVIEQLQKEIYNLENITISAGIGQEIYDIMDLKNGFQQASKALECGRLLKGQGSVIHYDDLGVYRILAINKEDPEMNKFCQEFLGKLILSDENNNTDYIRTLDTVLRYNDNLREAARELFIHHNTLHYRIARIEEITGMELKSAETRLNLQIALKIYRMNCVK